MTGPVPAWRDYQEEAAALFRELGFTAETDVRVQGARAVHLIDVLGTYRHAGLTVTWVGECKRWRARVGKAQVLTLRSVVEDIGADRGIILAEHGFQAGARQATERSNVVATSLAALRRDAAATLAEQRLRGYPERLAGISRDY